MSSAQDRFVGSIVGHALGDALGAPFEGGPLERLLWRFLGKSKDGKSRYTDDTQMSLDLIDVLLAEKRVDQNQLADRFASSYRWSRGYGPAAGKILKKIKLGMPWEDANKSIYPDGSFGNGAAMRAPCIGLYFVDDVTRIEQETTRAARVTHCHPLAVEGALLMARATASAIQEQAPEKIIDHLHSIATQEAYTTRLDIAKRWLLERGDPAPQQVASQLGNGISATASVVTAIYIALRHEDRDFNEMLAFAVHCRGDVDTIAAMAGAIWGAKNGYSKLPSDALERLENENIIREKAMRLYAAQIDRKGHNQTFTVDS